MSARQVAPALLVVLVLVLAGCAGDDFERADAISVLSAIGNSEAEATCMADALASLDQLDAADPGRSLDEGSRQALVAASSHCVSTAVLPRSVQRTALEAAVDEDDPEGTPMGGSRSSSTGLNADNPGVLRQFAIAHLELAGRTQVYAECVVDYLIALEAQHLFSAPEFGLGLDLLEADAFASCL